MFKFIRKVSEIQPHRKCAILIIGSWFLCKRNYIRNSILHRNFSSVIQQFFFHSFKFFLLVTMETIGSHVIHFASKTNFRLSKPEILLIFLYFVIKLKQVQFNAFTSSSRRIYIYKQQIEFSDHLFVIVKAFLIFLKIIKSFHMIFIQSRLNQPFIHIKGGVVTKIELFSPNQIILNNILSEYQ